MSYTPETNTPVTADTPRPPADGAIRASDTEREAALQELGRHFAAGRLDRAEFDERSNTAFAARTRADLYRLFTDLPGGPSGQDETAAQPGAGRTDPQAAGRSAPIGRGPFGNVPALAVVTFASVVAAIAIAGVTQGHVHFPFPLIPILFILSRRIRRSNRRPGS